MDAPIYRLEGVVKTKEEMDDFEGPLDLILFLLSKNKMEIRDIQISKILDQYLDWMRQRRELDLDVASEFVTMASHLVYIKTKMLLSIGDEEALSEMEELIASLEAHKRHEEYEKIKTVTPALASRYVIGQDYLTKPAEPLRKERDYRYTHESRELRLAMEDVFARSEQKLPPPLKAFQGIVGHEPYPVGKKAREILLHLLKNGISQFRTLFRGNRSRSEIVATFIAVLELCKTNHIRLTGAEQDYTVTCVDDGQQGELPELTSDIY